MNENLKPKKQLAEFQKENNFLKKSSDILREGKQLEAYQFIKQNNKKFGLRWLFKRLDICPNAYYSYPKNRKAVYHNKKTEIKENITDIYHSQGGVVGYRTMQASLVRRGFKICRQTVHKDMNTELNLFSISRKRKQNYVYGRPWSYKNICPR